MYCTYVLKGSSNPSFYIGHSADLKKRIEEHNQGKVLSTKKGQPWKLIYYEAFLNQHAAQDRERKLKQRGLWFAGREHLGPVSGVVTGLRPTSAIVLNAPGFVTTNGRREG